MTDSEWTALVAGAERLAGCTLVSGFSTRGTLLGVNALRQLESLARDGATYRQLVKDSESKGK